MEKTIKSRSEMNPEYLWDLSVVFKNDDAWYQTLEEVKEKIKEYEKYQDHFMESATSLYELLKYFDDIGDEYVPKNSLLREFIGGSIFEV